ncbi:MAG: tRNA modification GTPase [Synergistales bacterium]|jgi:tRNA modification GTPase|nr:tRNA modification GTPase [Synergistales bacterium]
MNGDVIAAVATAWGEAGIGIVKISGTGARDLVDGLFRGTRRLSQSPPRYMNYGHIVNSSGEVIDEVLAVWFKAPCSYTGEEVAEIHCHGGSLAVRRCLEEVLARGARMAGPGEFTRRAFLNGRIDLAQAESVIGIIRARSAEALKAAARSLSGEFSKQVSEVHEELLEFSSLVEAGLDFPEEDIPLLEKKEATRRLKDISTRLSDLTSRAASGNLLREGIRVALVGRPNVGKSSLLNAFLSEARAIVTSMPGTTRDIIEEVLTHRGVPIRLVDTAGIRRPSDEVEAIGVSRARDALREADVRIWVIDGNEPLTEEDLEIASQLNDKPHIVAVNKADLPLVVKEKQVQSLLPESSVRIISAQTGSGVEELKEDIVALFLGEGTLDEGLNTTARQLEELRLACEAVRHSLEAFTSGLGEDAAAAGLLDARKCLERILGIEADDSLLDTIFRNFCIGK